jgi:hypothetical protein
MFKFLSLEKRVGQSVLKSVVFQHYVDARACARSFVTDLNAALGRLKLLTLRSFAI